MTFLDRFTTAHVARDVDGLLDCFTDDIDYRDLFFGNFHGRAALRELFARTFRESSAHTWTITRSVAGPGSLVAEWKFDFTISDAVAAGAGSRLAFPGVSWFDLRGDRCVRYREFFDRTATLHAQGIAPGTVARIVARRSEVRVLQPGSAMLPS